VKKIYINHSDYYLPLNIEKNITILNQSKKNKSEIVNMIKKIGIKSRRISDKNQFSTDLAIESSKKVLRKFDKKNIDFLIYCTNTPDFLLPSNACIIHDKLKLNKNCGAFDIGLACSGYVYSLSVAKSLIYSKTVKNVLLITADTYSKFIPLNDFKNRILFGDGSSATLLSSKKTPESFEVLKSTYGTDGSGSNFAIIKNFGNKFRNSKNKSDNNIFIDGPGLYNFALNVIPDQVKSFIKKFNLKNQIDYYIFHQANKFMIDGLINIMKINKKKVIIDMSQTGNTVSTSIPIIIKKFEDKFKKNDKILLVGFGGGLSWGITLIKKT